MELGVVSSILVEVVKVNCVTEAECKAVDRAVRLGFSTNRRKFKVMSDCKSAIDVLNGVVIFKKPHLKDATSKITSLTEYSGMEVQYEWVPRNKNKAHKFARAIINNRMGAFGLSGMEKDIYQYMLAREESERGVIGVI